MYNNYNGSEIIYHIWQSSGNICRCLETEFDKVDVLFVASVSCWTCRSPAAATLLSHVATH